MATTCGIHIDGRRFHLVVLDGSARKHRVTAVTSGEVAPDEDPVAAVAKALRRAVKEHKIKPGEVQLAVDSGLAAFRTLTLPFDDLSKIEDVLKFEIENDLPQWDIDDVLVDFIVLKSKPGVESNLLVTALPKDRMEMQLTACEAGGLEAQEAELDGTALFDAAYESGCLAEDSAQVLVHVGDNSTTVVVADGGRLSSIRAIRAGANLPVIASEADDEAEEVDVDAPPSEEAEADELAEYSLEMERRLRQTAQRIRRELGRTISGARTVHDIEGVYVCGHALPDLVHDEILDTRVVPLEVLTEEAIDRPSEAVIAYGAALHAMGGGLLSPRLRREELRFTGKFERIEMPLVTFSILLFTLLLLKLLITNSQLEWRDEGPPDTPGDMQLWLTASNRYVFPNPDELAATRLTDPPESIANYARRAEDGEITDRTKYGQIREISRRIKNEIVALKKKLGQVSDIEQPQSALEATTLVMGVLYELTNTTDMRVGIRDYKAQYRPGTSRRGDSVEIQLEMDFFADSAQMATRHYSSVQIAMKEKPWCLEYDSKGSTPHDDGKGISADRITITVDLSKAEQASAATEETAE